MMTAFRLIRPNMTEQTSEPWQPPAFVPLQNWRTRLTASLRRFLDLQAASIWNDLTVLLPPCRGKFLDVGCGAQPYRQLVSPEAEYQGIDHIVARETFGYDFPQTTYYSGDRWPIDDASMDVVLSTETLEHVLDPDAFLAEASRVLKPGGHLIMTVPFAARWHYIPRDYWRFTPSALIHLLKRSGLSDVQVYARGNALTVACYKVMAIFLKLLMPQGASPLAGVALRLLGLPSIPFVVLLALLGQLSMRGNGGVDCLGYTVVASK
jgi:SAM-dependent methyltransferase